MSISTFDLFKIGIGPSSSHTVGPMVAAKQFALELYDQDFLPSVSRIRVDLYGSLALTGEGHGTPKAVLLGLLGNAPADINAAEAEGQVSSLRRSKELPLLSQHVINFDEQNDLLFHRGESLPYHANGIGFQAYDAKQKVILKRLYYSVGGGFVVDEHQAKADAPVIEDQRQLAYPFKSAEELLQHCDNTELSIADIMYANEASWQSHEETDRKLEDIWRVMHECIENGCRTEGELPGGLNVKRRANGLHKQLASKRHSPPQHADPLEHLDWVTLYALAVNEENAAGGKVVTAPTNGAAGIIPAVLNFHNNFAKAARPQDIKDFLLTAAAIGILFKENASISGAEVGCQGEVGSACSMAAAGLAAVLGGTPRQVENAAEIAMEHNLGLTCDPIGGLVQIPCIERNAVASVKAIQAARMALCNNGEHMVSLDKVIKTMGETGKDMMDKYKETSLGGLAAHAIEIPLNIVEC